MIAYNKDILEHLAIKQKARNWFSNGQLNVTEMAAILKAYPLSVYKPNVFIRLGLFVFMLFMVSAAMGFFTLFTVAIFSVLDTMTGYWIFMNVLFAGLCFFFLEKFIQWRNWFGNGMDDALLYSALSFTGAVFAISIFAGDMNEENSFMLWFLIMLPVLLFAAVRYIDRIASIAAVICLYCLVFVVLMKLGSIAKFIIPFAFMVLSALLFFLFRKLISDQKHSHYRKCLYVARTLVMLVFYMSGNYYVIRESSVEFFDLNLSENEDIPFAFFFYVFTALVPLVYLYFGLKHKDKHGVWSGLILIALAVLTFKYYFSLGHPEVTLTLAGLIMIVLSYMSIKYLRTDKHGITFKDDPNEDNFLKTNAEALAIAQSFGSAASPQQQGVEFGGGKFGGGGSGSNY